MSLLCTHTALPANLLTEVNNTRGVWKELQGIETDRKAWGELIEDLCPIGG